MRCSKCSYITFDYYSNCPKCGESFDSLKSLLGIIDYSVREETDYRVDEKVFKQEEKEERADEVQEQIMEDKAHFESVEEKKAEDEFEIEQTKLEDDASTSDDEIEGISLGDLLETTKIEE